MRKPRVIIYDDEVSILGFMQDFFALRGYEVLALDKPVHCPVYGKDEQCDNHYPCSDVALTDLNMANMNGIQMLQLQSQRGCRIDVRNRAIMSGHLDDASIKSVRDLGLTFFQKPFSLAQLDQWISDCEQRIDLTQPLGIKRSAERQEFHEEITCILPIVNDVLNGSCINVSSTGLCLKFNSPLALGQQITIEASFSPAKTASVRWIREIEDHTYLAGLQYA